MRYDKDLGRIFIDVEELSAFCNKTPDIDCRFSSPHPQRCSFEELSKLYGRELVWCHYDIPISLEYDSDKVSYTIDSRIDVIFKKGNSLRIDLIRKVSKFDFFAPLRNDLLSELKCHLLFYMQKENIPEISARIYYILSSNSKKQKYFDFQFTKDELLCHFSELIEKFSYRAIYQKERICSALRSAADAVFPYDSLREGQEIMIKEVYSAIKQGKRLFVEAPTGIGKTASALYPSVRALGNNLADKVFYLTSKASTRREAFKGAAKLFENGVELRTVVISAKEQVCLCPSRALSGASSLCNPIDCPYAAGYYNRVDKALDELLSSSHGYTTKYILQVARQHRVCPYELSLDLSEFGDIVICDYNYVFDPSVFFRRYFNHEKLTDSKYIFLVDEAHNLVDRARDMYSASIEGRDLEELYAKIEPEYTELQEAFERLILHIRTMRKLCKDNLVKSADGTEHGFYVNNSEFSDLIGLLADFNKVCAAFLKANGSHPLRQKIESVYQRVKKYICISEYFDSRFYNCIYVNGDSTLIKIFCLDPSYILHKIQQRAVSTVMFSATLTPIDYFSRLLGGDGRSQKLSLDSPFEPSNLCVAVARYINTRFEDRTKNYSKYVSVIAASVSQRVGNYIVYFPSYECLEGTYSAFIKKYPDVDTVVQKRGMNLSQKEEFLNFFKNDSGVLRIGFCVLGGSFSEGVDLPGARLIGTVIFGVGLPGLSNEGNIIKEYYDNRGEIGYDYAYAFKGMNNVLQAAGRVIRQDDDIGVVVLADDRYLDEKYISLFPKHWKNVKSAQNARELAEIMQNFWQNR